MKEKRFEVVFSLGTMGEGRFRVDRGTGVNCLQACSGDAGGLTPRLDREGKPVISPVKPYHG